MADMAGTTKEQVSKTLAELMNQGLIRCRAKHFKYIDREGLSALVEGQPSRKRETAQSLDMLN
jgi:DNA-binding transcriptional regulator YhcF (GntR family)